MKNRLSNSIFKGSTRRGTNVLALAATLLFITVGLVFAAIGDTERVSVDSNGAQALGGDSYDPEISADGRYVVFSSEATNLVSGDTNGKRDCFIYDRNNGTTTRVSVANDGTQADEDCLKPVISADGRYVAFFSRATTLLSPGVDNNSGNDVYVYDLTIGDISVASRNTAGDQANGHASYPSISEDGRYVAFTSAATNLAAADSDTIGDIFVRDRTAGTTELISVHTNNTKGDDFSSVTSISADGRYVAFGSEARTLVDNDTNWSNDIFVHDRTTGTTTRVSVASDGTQADSGSRKPAISPGGRYVAFESDATNLVVPDANGNFNDIYVHDRVTGTTTRVSVDSAGTQGDSDSWIPAISSDGRYVAFESDATNLVANDTNGLSDIFVHDRTTGTTTRVSLDSAGVQAAGGGSQEAFITSDGRYVAFQSEATNLVPGDTNVLQDIFVHDYLGPPAATVGKDDDDKKTCALSSAGATCKDGPIKVVAAAGTVTSDQSCHIVIEEKSSGNFELDGRVFDVRVICNGVEKHSFDPPLKVCIRPTSAQLSAAGFSFANLVMYNYHGGSWTGYTFPQAFSENGYFCLLVDKLSLFTISALQAPTTGFAPGVVTALGEQPASKAYFDVTASGRETGAWQSPSTSWRLLHSASSVRNDSIVLEIPKLNLQLPIVGVPLTIDGWDVTWLGEQAGYLEGTAFPTWAGNTAITAHVWNADNTPGPFIDLHTLQHGDHFSIHAYGQVYTYEVRESLIVQPNKLSVFDHSDYDMVTLITCQNFNEKSGKYSWRLAVQAVLMRVESE